MNTLVQDKLQAIVTVLALVNPVMCSAIFAQIEGARPRRSLVADATKAAVAIIVILVIAALLGIRILHLFGVSLDAFSVAGGGVLSWIGFAMLRGNPTANKPSRPDGASQKPSLSPLILFAASPGTITGVITLAAVHTRLTFPVTALVAVSVATVVVMWLAILQAISMGSRISSGGFVHDTVTRFMGLIVIAMGVQFALTGIRAFLTGTR